MPLVKCKAESLDLTANYTFTGDVTLASGGSLNLISTQTASSSSSISFTTGIDSTYDEYWFIFNNIHSSNNGANFTFQGSTNGGSSYGVTMTTTGIRAYHKEDGTQSSLLYDTNGDQAQGTGYQQFGTSGNANDECIGGILKLYNPSSTTYVKHFMTLMNSLEAFQFTKNEYYAGYFNTTSAINGMDFKFSAGTIDDGTIQLFGVSQ